MKPGDAIASFTSSNSIVIKSSSKIPRNWPWLIMSVGVPGSLSMMANGKCSFKGVVMLSSPSNSSKSSNLMTSELKWK